MDLSDRRILLTGAAQGLGLGISRRLARAGARIVLVDCDPVVKDHLADPVFAGSAIALVRDLVEPDAARDLVRTAIEKVGWLNGLVNCAAWSLHKALAETTIQEFDRLVAINQRAPFFLSQEFAKAVCDTILDPCIVNIASVNASIGNANLTGYASTKGGARRYGPSYGGGVGASDKSRNHFPRCGSHHEHGEFDRRGANCRPQTPGALSGEALHYGGRDSRPGRLFVRSVSDLDHWLQLGH